MGPLPCEKAEVYRQKAAHVDQEKLDLVGSLTVIGQLNCFLVPSLLEGSLVIGRLNYVPTTEPQCVLPPAQDSDFNDCL